MVSHLLSPHELSVLSPPLPPAAAKALTAIFRSTHLRKGAVICAQGAPAVLAPNLSRSKDGMFPLRLEMASEGRLALASASDLLALMVADADIRGWGNALMGNDLIRRGARDWALAALPTADRLAWFRQEHPPHETLFPHALIPSYLGMTPVTLRRLRNA